MTHISYNPWNPYKPTTCSTNFDLKPIPLDCRSTGRSPPAPLASRAPGAWFVLAIFDAFGYYCEDFVFVLKVLQPRLHMLGLLLPLRHELSPRCGSSLPRPANWDAEAQEAQQPLLFIPTVTLDAFSSDKKMLVGSQLPCYKSKGMAGNRHGSFCKGTILEYTAIPCHPMSLY